MVTLRLLTSAFSTTGAPSAPLLVLLALALPGPVAAAIWWVKGRETRNISLEEGSDDALTEAAGQQEFRTREASTLGELKGCREKSLQLFLQIVRLKTTGFPPIVCFVIHAASAESR
ncbi:hypothetical protein OKW45_007433 [Paraburkholderia sp. WSM4175]